MPAKKSPSTKKPTTKTSKSAAKKPSTKTSKSAAKKSPAKKTPAKKTAAKKTAAKKTAAKKKPSTKASTSAAKKAPAKKTAKKPAPSTTPLAMKLGILEGMWIIDNAPPGFELLKPPKVDIGVDLNGPLRGHECVLSFVVDSGDVAFFADAWQAFKPAKGEVNLWLAYPKRGAGFATDLTGTRGWDRLTALGLEQVAQVVVDDVWSALRFRPV